MFERFAKDARLAVVSAQEEARGLGHRHIGAAHLVLGLLAEDGGTAARALAEHGADLAALREAVRRSAGAPAPAGAAGTASPPRRGLLGRLAGRGHIPFTRPAKRSLEESLRVALDRGDTTISGGHVLLGVLRTGDPGALRALTDAGVAPADLRGTTERLLGEAA
ncbi:Clp protease N-terminal domain-containing protein [Streptomonospora nanhaiensis]|uniref:ATP-dependent Clp protease ATP-binding subunit ClpC n=1 Tax=Streptomonospora nanhaiensis TaxID=1323731 RepID=A0A853BQF2_9ACTN|nr:Clp protease N-terminal domain-containing protein [Streptomonospora nanhaiensis]MBV2363885.1 hypothetical protein [Streptomonospora nanhaiensis]MBX9388254.1 hypothetical protein [Streptomonospora nanhaiensis]NYI96807.1 ATP-dependent Clp protease ATP-binding subunit ClpC [Streptomonospora nanhaiensis]